MLRIGRSSTQRDLAAERRAQAQRDAGIPDRNPTDLRPPFELDLREVCGPYWHCEPALGRCTYRVRDAETMAVQFCAPPKTILARALKIVPRVLGLRNA